MEFTTEMASQRICSAQSKAHRLYRFVFLQFLVSGLKGLKWEASYLVPNFFRRSIVNDFTSEWTGEFCICKVNFISSFEREDNSYYTLLRTVFYGVAKKLEQNAVIYFEISADQMF